MARRASVEQKSWRLFLPSCLAEAQYLMKNIFMLSLQLIPFAQVEEMGVIAHWDMQE